MKMMMLNSSGNVGKSLTGRELFYPRLKDPLIIEVETINKGSKEMKDLNVFKFKAGDDFSTIYLKMMENENVIVDVGASNLSIFWEQMRSFAGVEEMFDLFIVPTVPHDKEMSDTYKTISFLKGEGIPEEKIKVIFNKVKTSVSKEFAVLLSAPFPFDTDLFLLEKTSLYNDLGFLGKTIKDIYNPNVDSYRADILKESDPKEKIKLIKYDLANRQAVQVKNDMDVIFEKIADMPSAWKDAGKKTKSKKETVEVVVEATETNIDDDDL